MHFEFNEKDETILELTTHSLKETHQLLRTAIRLYRAGEITDKDLNKQDLVTSLRQKLIGAAVIYGITKALERDKLDKKE